MLVPQNHSIALNHFGNNLLELCRILSESWATVIQDNCKLSYFWNRILPKSSPKFTQFSWKISCQCSASAATLFSIRVAFFGFHKPNAIFGSSWMNTYTWIQFFFGKFDIFFDFQPLGNIHSFFLTTLWIKD